MKYMSIALLFVLFSCKTPQQSTSVIKQQEAINTNSHLSLIDENVLYEFSEQELIRLINEKFTVKIKQIKYDTSKPVDTLTQRPPILEETDIVIEKDSEMTEIENTNIELFNEQKTDVDENKEAAQTINTETKEKTKSGLSNIQKGFMTLGVIMIVSIVIFIVVKVKSIWK